MNARGALVAALCLIAAGCDGSSGPGSVPDARPIVYARLEIDWALYRVNARGGEPSRITVPVVGAMFPALSPDGSRLAFVSLRDPPGIYIGSPDGSGAARIYPVVAEHIAWSPDGARLALEVEGEIVVVNADGTNPQTITAAFDSYAGHPSWAPNGRIAFSTFSRLALESDIYTMTSTGGDLRLLVAGEGREARDPAWSPNGSRLAFALGHHGESAIFTVDANGDNLEPVTESGIGATDLGPAWAPSGAWIAFQREESGRTDVHVIRTSGGDPRSLTTGTEWGGVRPTW